MKTSKATMADVAKKAGVSAATVARVIYNNGYVKDETRIAVESAVKLTGYSPSLVARSLRTSRSFTLGMVVSESQLNAFPPAVAQVIQLEAVKHGYTVITLNNQNIAELEEKGVRRLLDHHVDAVIFCTAVHPANVRLIEERGTPTVQIERVAARVGNVVTVDGEKGIRQAVDHLVAQGHRTFAYFGGDKSSKVTELPPDEAVEALREQHFLESLRAHGITGGENYIRRTPYYVEGKPAHQPAFYLIEDILKLVPRPTAIICGSDLLAAAALQGIHAAGLKVPEDISIVGFDDTLADILTPALSSIAQPVEDLGRLAVQLAMSAIENQATPAKSLVTTTTLVLRQSTGPAPRPQTT